MKIAKEYANCRQMTHDRRRIKITILGEMPQVTGDIIVSNGARLFV